MNYRIANRRKQFPGLERQEIELRWNGKTPGFRHVRVLLKDLMSWTLLLRVVPA